MRGEVLLVLPTSWNPNRQTFLAQLGVSEGGLGEQLFAEIYDAFFVHSIELRQEFERYYVVEYGTPKNYAWRVHGLKLEDEDLDHDMIFLVFSLPQIVSDDYVDNQLETVLASIEQLERVQHEAKT